MEQNHFDYGDFGLHDFAFPNSFSETSHVFNVQDGNEYEDEQDFGKRPIPIPDPRELMAFSSQENIGSLFDRLFPKRRRVNSKNLMDLEDDLLGVIFLQLIGGEGPKVVRQRQLKDMLAAYSLAFTNNRTTQVFRTHIGGKIHTIDTLFPLQRVEEALRLRVAPPTNISFLSLMAGSSLRVLRLPGFISFDEKNEAYLNSQLSRTRSLMRSLARNCTRLTEMAFQDAGCMGDGIGRLLFSSNLGLKKLQVDVPCPDLFLALAESKCDIEELTFLRVQTGYLSELRSLLSERGAPLRKLAIEMCFPLGSAFEPTQASRARCRRREKSFTEAIEGITRTTMSSLRTLHLHPDRRAAWFREFVQRFQMIGQADLIIANGNEPMLYPASRSVDTPRPRFRRMSMDLLVNFFTEAAFDDYLERLDEPDTLSIVKNTFLHSYISNRNGHLNSFVKSTIYRKGKGVKNIQILCPCHRSPVYEALSETISKILDRFEEKFSSLEQIQALWIPVHTVAYLGRGIGYEKFLARLTHLRAIHLVKTTPETYLDRMVILGIPTFLRAVMHACPELESIYISSKDYTQTNPQDRTRIMKRAIEDAVIALAEYQEANPKVDVWSLRNQISVWY